MASRMADATHGNFHAAPTELEIACWGLSSINMPLLTELQTSHTGRTRTSAQNSCKEQA